MSNTTVATTKKRHASKKQKTNGIQLWESVKAEVYLTDEFNLEGERKAKADKYLHALKLKVWRISLAKGNKDDALKVVFGYNKAVNDLLATQCEPERDDAVPETVDVTDATADASIDVIDATPSAVQVEGTNPPEECPPDSQEG